MQVDFCVAFCKISVMGKDHHFDEEFLQKPSIRISEVPVGGQYLSLFKAKLVTGEYALILGGPRGEVVKKFQLDGIETKFVRVSEIRSSGKGFWDYLRSGDTPVVNITSENIEITAPKYSPETLPRPGHWPLVPGIKP